jgi:hypothetical protein
MFLSQILQQGLQFLRFVKSGHCLLHKRHDPETKTVAIICTTLSLCKVICEVVQREQGKGQQNFRVLVNTCIRDQRCKPWLCCVIVRRPVIYTLCVWIVWLFDSPLDVILLWLLQAFYCTLWLLVLKSGARNSATCI